LKGEPIEVAALIDQSELLTTAGLLEVRKIYEARAGAGQATAGGEVGAARKAADTN